MRRAGLIILGVLVLWLCACSAQNLAGAATGQTALPDNQPATQTAIIPTPGLVNNAIVTATRLPTQTPTATLVPSPTLPSITQIEPEILFQCMETPVSAFSDLDLPEQLGLLVVQVPPNHRAQETYSAGVLTKFNPTPQRLVGIEFRSEYGGLVSPDHRWILTRLPTKDTLVDEVWVSSSDGQLSWLVSAIPSYNLAWWLNSETIIFAGSPVPIDPQYLEGDDDFPYLSINPFTLEQTEIPYLALARSHERYLLDTFSTPDESYMLYGRINLGETLYNIGTGESSDVFGWFNAEYLTNMTIDRQLRIWPYGDGLFALSVSDADRFDVGVGISIAQARTSQVYAQIMSRVLLPEEYRYARVLGFVPERDEFLIYQFADYSWVDIGPAWLYTYQFETQRITDYCISLQDFEMRGWNLISPEGRFVAVNLEKSSTRPALLPAGFYDNEETYFTLVLDLDTGAFTYLSGMQAVGWVLPPEGE